jgi:hypothetical protein
VNGASSRKVFLRRFALFFLYSSLGLNAPAILNFKEDELRYFSVGGPPGDSYAGYDDVLFYVQTQICFFPTSFKQKNIESFPTRKTKTP